MTTASVVPPIGLVDHAEAVGTLLVRNFFSLLWSASMLGVCTWAQLRSAGIDTTPAELRFAIVVSAFFLLLPFVLAIVPVAAKHRPTDSDGVLRWCEVIPVGAGRGALWIARDEVRLVGSGYDEHIAFTDLVRVEARVKGPFSLRDRFLNQTHPLVLTKRDGTEVSLIVAAPTSIARSIRRAAGLA